MPSSLPAAAPSAVLPFLLRHALLIPGVFACAAVAVHASGLDDSFTSLFFDTAAGVFPARSSLALEIAGHRFAKSAVEALWLVLLATSLATSLARRPRRQRALLWTTVVAMALGPAIVVALKDINAYHCPWDLKRYGGYAELARAWFVAKSDAGRCFPSGHAAGGFSLVALAFAGLAAGNARLRTLGFVAAFATGSAFSVVRIAQGAHFLSHNLWSAAIDWCAAALVFAPLLQRHPLHAPASPKTADASAGGAPEPMAKFAPRGWRRLAPAARYALRGLRMTWDREAAFRQEVVIALLLVPVALTVAVSPLERLMLIASLLAVLIVELVNTAIEAVVDLASLAYQPLAGVAKDAAAAAVLLAIGVAAATWITLLWPGG